MKAINFIGFALLWSALIGLSFYYQQQDARAYIEKIAYQQAEWFFDHIVMVRQWNAQHGGVYVPVTDKTQPNPYLQSADRDVVTTDGKQLTLVNPAFMTRQLAQMEAERSGIRFNITSLQPIRPENQADPWETQALQAFEQGQRVYQQLVDIDEQPFFRYMAPLFLEASCMKCHHDPNHKVGDIRGGISVSIPANRIQQLSEQRISHLKHAHVGIGGIGLLALLAGYVIHARLNRRLNKAQSHVHLAYQDALTGLPNRRYYDLFIKREWNRAARHQYPLSMIMIDIDYFKAYNDHLGHLQGDECLRQVARRLRKYFRRSGDLIARYGGEEFCVVAACDQAQILQLAEILRAGVESMECPHPDSKVSAYVTISLGVATLIPQDSTQYKDLILHADSALYVAKTAGRNRVVQYAAPTD